MLYNMCTSQNLFPTMRVRRKASRLLAHQAWHKSHPFLPHFYNMHTSQNLFPTMQTSDGIQIADAPRIDGAPQSEFSIPSQLKQSFVEVQPKDRLVALAGILRQVGGVNVAGVWGV